jgi:hypothetical protein
MSGPQPTMRTWFVRVAPGEAHVRCSYLRSGRRVLRFTVQLEILREGVGVPVARYDNAHGFCHRDTLHPDGTQDKTPVFVGDVNDTFTYAIEDFRANWRSQRDRFLEEASHD